MNLLDDSVIDHQDSVRDWYPDRLWKKERQTTTTQEG